MSRPFSHFKWRPLQSELKAATTRADPKRPWQKVYTRLRRWASRRRKLAYLPSPPTDGNDAGIVFASFRLLLIAGAIPRNVHCYWVIPAIDVALALGGAVGLVLSENMLVPPDTAFNGRDGRRSLP